MYRAPGEPVRYEYRVVNIAWGRKGETAKAEEHMKKMSDDGWRLVTVTDGGEAWSFFWERART